MINKTIVLDKTRRGLPALWERGGGMTNTGRAQIIANPDGSPKRPNYIKGSGERANLCHALFVVKEGDLVIQVYRNRINYDIQIKRISKIYYKTTPTLHARYWLSREEYEKNCGEWEVSDPEKTIHYFVKTDFSKKIKDFKITNIIKVSDKHIEFEYSYTFDELVADIETIHEFKDNRWDTEPTGKIKEAVEAAKRKTTIYHCRKPVYYLQPKK